MAERQLNAVVEESLAIAAWEPSEDKLLGKFLLGVASLPEEDLKEIFSDELKNRIEAWRSKE